MSATELEFESWAQYAGRLTRYAHLHRKRGGETEDAVIRQWRWTLATRMERRRAVAHHRMLQQA